VASLATVEYSNSEVLELVVPDKGRIAGKPLKDIGLPAGSIIGVIVRGEQVIIPTGEDHLEPGDHAIVFVLPGAIAEVESFFS
jgi:trk system potassium uptake protein TrkA